MKKDHLCVYTDASFNCTKKIGAYAFYLVLNGKEAHYANSYPQTVQSSKDAEMLALGHALNFLMSEEKLKGLKGITIYMDNTMAIEEIRRQTPGIGRAINKLWQSVITKTGSKVNNFKHVKAHSGKEGVDHHYHNWCDRNARIELRKVVGVGIPLKHAGDY